MLKNAKDARASEALEIATYTAVERLARRVGDDETARLAASIRAGEERMLARILREIPKLTDAVVRADVNGDSSYDVKTTGAADALRDAARTKTTKTAASAKRTARQARKVPGVARGEGQVKAPSRPKRTSRSRATTRSRPRRSPASSRSTRTSTWPRSKPTSARARTAPRS